MVCNAWAEDGSDIPERREGGVGALGCGVDGHGRLYPFDVDPDDEGVEDPDD